MASFLEVTFLDVVSRRLGKEEETDCKNDGPKHLDGDWNAVRASIHSFLGAIVDAGGEQDADGDTELVTRYDGSTNLLGGDLTHIQDDDGGNKTDTKTSDKTTSYEETERSGGSLEDDTDDEDAASSNDCSSTTDPYAGN